MNRKLIALAMATGLAALAFHGMPFSDAAFTPHAIIGIVRDNDSNPVLGSTVYVNNSRTGDSLSSVSDYIGRYSVDIDGYPNGYLAGDVLNITAVYHQFDAFNTIVVNGEPLQQCDVNLDYLMHIIEGYVTRTDGSPAQHYAVNVTNMDRNEYRITPSGLDGYYWMDIGVYYSGFAVNDDICVSVFSTGFYGVKYGYVSSGTRDMMNVTLSDIEKPVITPYSAPSSVILNQQYRIVAKVTDNMVVNSVKLYMRKVGQTLYTEYNMIRDDGGANDWNNNGIQDANLWGQSTSRNLPLQTSLGDLQYYFKANDNVFTVTLPATDPQANPFIISVLDTVPPALSHTPFTTMEAGAPRTVLAHASDNIAVGRVNLHVRAVGQPEYVKTEMSYTGTPGEYEGTVPPQFLHGTLDYYMTCNDTSNNSVRLPTSGSWPVNVVDTTPPALIHDKINSVIANTPINFTCQVSDIIGIDSVWMNLTDVHGGHYEYPMNSSGGGYWYHKNESGQNLSGTIHYCIWVNDTSGNLASVSQFTMVYDYGTPLIFHEPDVLLFNEPKVISAYVVDDTNISSVIMAYKNVGESNFTYLAMTSLDTTGVCGNFTAVIPAQTSLGNVSYYINATDAATPVPNNSSWPAINPPYTTEVLDLEPPTVIDATPTVFFWGSVNTDIRAVAEDNHQIAHVYLYFINETSADWTELPLDPDDVDSTGSGNYTGVLPAPASPGIVRYYLKAFDVSGNNATYPAISPKLNAIELEFFDISLPMINVAFPEELGVNRTAGVFVNATDDQGIADVRISIKGTEDATFHSIELALLENGTFEADMPVQNHSGMLQFYVQVTDVHGNSNQTQVLNVTVTNNPPEIIHTGVSTAPVGENVAFVAQVLDDLAVENVIFSWKVIGTAQYNDLVMSQAMSGIYQANTTFQDPVVIQYHIMAWDAETESVWPTGDDHEISITDLQAPEIIHVPLVDFNSTLRPVISAVVTDNYAVASVEVWFRNSTSDSFHRTVLQPVSGSPGEYLAVLGLQPEGNFTYYIEASDGINVARSPDMGNYTAEVLSSWGDNLVSIVMFSLLLVLLVVAGILVYVRHSRKSIKREGVSPGERVDTDENT